MGVRSQLKTYCSPSVLFLRASQFCAAGLWRLASLLVSGQPGLTDFGAIQFDLLFQYEDRIDHGMPSNPKWRPLFRGHSCSEDIESYGSGVLSIILVPIYQCWPGLFARHSRRAWIEIKHLRGDTLTASGFRRRRRVCEMALASRNTKWAVC